MKPSLALFIVVLLGFAVVYVEAAKIAVLVFPTASHFFMMEAVGQKLETRDHQVTYLMWSIEPLFEKSQVKSKILFHTPKYPKGYFLQQTADRVIKDGYMSVGFMTTFIALLTEMCDTLLSSQEILEKLKEYDMLFADNTLFGCGNLLKEKVGIPSIVDFSSWGLNDLYNWQYAIDWPLSYIPAHGVYKTREHGIPFLWRVANVLAYFAMNILEKGAKRLGMGSLKSKYDIAPDKSFSQIVSETDLVLIPIDWALEWPRPVPPNVKIIGPMTPKQPKQLPGDLETFMQSASRGIVLVSFGSMASSLDDRRSRILSEAFSMLQGYKVMWKYNKSFPDVKNLKTVSWMPQNDILGHSCLKLFMTHGGINSVYEGAYHGVPLLLTPLWGDQAGNAARVKTAGFGESVNIRTGDYFTAEYIAEQMGTILDNPRYKANAIKVSKLLQDRRQSSTDEAADWIEYVLKHNGTRHLRPRSAQLPFYQYFLLDVYSFLFAVFFVLSFIIYKACMYGKSKYRLKLESFSYTFTGNAKRQIDF